MVRPASLSLVVPKSTSQISSTVASSMEASGSSPPSPRQPKAIYNGGIVIPIAQPYKEIQPTSPELTSLPQFPSSPPDTPKHTRDTSRGFFSNLKASKSSSKVYRMPNQPTIRQVSEDLQRLDTSDSIYSSKKSPGSTPDLNFSMRDTDSMENDGGKEKNTKPAHSVFLSDMVEFRQAADNQTPRPPIGDASTSDTSTISATTERFAGTKPKPRFGKLLTRTRSTRMDENVSGRKSKPTTPILTTGPEMQTRYDNANESKLSMPKTAPLQQDRSLREMMSSGVRNRSADRRPESKSSQENMQSESFITGRRNPVESSQEYKASRAPVYFPTANYRENGSAHSGSGSHLFTNIKNTSSKAADGLGKAGNKFLGKITRSGSSNAREDERYCVTVINLPLVEQTRRTRIAERLEDSKDKTEFWMPALPWRCIDYLNYRGCEEEGLYRVPGSDREIRLWQKRFDQEGDINLFDEEELYDVNIIGSMFKSWLRELPTEIFPKAVQAKIAEQCAGETKVPQLLKDELSSLPPWNYYLLFAITCHLSLLTTCSDKNKMTYNNLCICFQPALKIDPFCFQFLVREWRDCWQGCWTEKEALIEEYRILDGAPLSDGSNAGSGTHSPSEFSAIPAAVADDRSLASSGSNKPSISGRALQGRPQRLTLTRPSEEQLSSRADAGPNVHTPTKATPLPEIAPMQPLSPIGPFN